jgi:hypothetical protein
LESIPGASATEARAFTAMMHDKFSRTFAGDSLGVKESGARRIPPELVLESAFGSGGTKAGLQFRDMQSAAVAGGKSVASEQEQFLRAVAAETTVGGKVNPTALTRFIEKNPDLMKRFPQVATDLRNTATADRLLKQVSTANKSSAKRISQRAAFTKLVGTERPTEAIHSILRGKNPTSDYGQLARLAKKTGPGAVAGLKAATIDAAVKHASGVDGSAFDFTKFKSYLTQPTATNKPSPLQMMVRQGVVTGSEAGQIRRFLTQSENITKALKDSTDIDSLLNDPAALTDLVVRIVGAKVGASVSSGGSSILAAGAGSRFARDIFEKIPTGKVGDILIEASENPKFMADLLRRPVNVRHAKTLRNQLNGYFYGSGITTFTDYAEGRAEDSNPAEESRAKQ